MRKLLTALAVPILVLSTHVFAEECLQTLHEVDKAMKTTRLGPDTIAKVTELRKKGMQLHYKGDHTGSL